VLAVVMHSKLGDTLGRKRLFFNLPLAVDKLQRSGARTVVT
jgi:hypothetical protein